MNNFKMKRLFLGLGLFGTELAIYLTLCFVLHIGKREMLLFAVLYFLELLFYSHYKFATILIWQEIMQMLCAHALYLIQSMIIAAYICKINVWKIILITGIMFCVVIVFGRAYRKMTKNRCGTRVLVLGAGKGAEDLEYVIVHNGYMFVNVIGYVDLETITFEKKSKNKKIAQKTVPFSSMEKFLEENYVDEVFIVDEALTSEKLLEITNFLHNRVPVVKYRPQLKIIQPYNTKVEDYNGNLFVSITDAKKRVFDKFCKRIVDICAGIAGTLLLVPLSIFVKVQFLRNGDREPIFFTQNRIGENGKIIKMYKYRSMVPNAEQLLEEMMEKDPKIKEEYLTNKKLDPDPRVTPFGEFLRRTSLDEFPQFLNVLKGEMSLIGPRPYLPREIEDMGKDYDTIIMSKPGITGMWQANGRSEVGFEDRCKLDVYYYDNWSIWLDLIIMVKTIKVVLYRDGAV